MDPTKFRFDASDRPEIDLVVKAELVAVILRLNFVVVVVVAVDGGIFQPRGRKLLKLLGKGAADFLEG